MRKIRYFSIILCFALLIQLLPMVAAAQESDLLDTSVTAGCCSFDAQVPLYGSDKMLETAQSAILYEANSETMMYAWNPDLKLQPASLVKIMTCTLMFC